MNVEDMLPKYRHGDRVRIDPSVETLPALPSYQGVIIEAIPSHAEQRMGYNLQIDGDIRQARRWFFYEDQLTLVSS
ncbi:MAG: hypothetical protein H7Y32_19330 [Chloroflexales bacterium]|nr:hypothetical protein [Chloroflexales bacterium]